jgi:hypothetical protein
MTLPQVKESICHIEWVLISVNVLEASRLIFTVYVT